MTRHMTPMHDAESPGRILRTLITVVLAIGALALLAVAQAPDRPAVDVEQFLMTAEVIGARPIGKGVTNPWRLTLSDGTTTHDAAFQSVDEYKEVARIGQGQELEFKDSYHYNIAAYRLARLLGLDDMVPVSVLRRWRRQNGALTWWIASELDEAERKAQRLTPPDVSAWSSQLYRMVAFRELIYDTDRNDTNILYTDDWQLWMIDFTRAFRRWEELQNPEALVADNRQLSQTLAALSEETLVAEMEGHLTIWEIRAVLARRDLVLERFEQVRTPTDP